jgi:16S rRNA G527 N7-methylase RsmG
MSTALVQKRQTLLLRGVLPYRRAIDKRRNHANKVFLRTIDALYARFPVLFATSQLTNEMRALVKHQGKSNPEAINYTDQALSFNQAFFRKNLYKNIYFLNWLRQQQHLTNTSHVIDIGSGAGVATIAWAMAIGAAHTHFLLMDRSLEQLHLAQQTLAALNIQRVSLQQSHIAEFPATAQGVHLISYWVCEQPQLPSIRSVADFRSAMQGGIVVIDYPEHIDRFAAWMQTHGLGEGAIRKSLSTETLSRLVRSYMPETQINVHGYYWKP